MQTGENFRLVIPVEAKTPKEVFWIAKCYQLGVTFFHFMNQLT